MSPSYKTGDLGLSQMLSLSHRQVMDVYLSFQITMDPYVPSVSRQPFGLRPLRLPATFCFTSSPTSSSPTSPDDLLFYFVEIPSLECATRPRCTVPVWVTCLRPRRLVPEGDTYTEPKGVSRTSSTSYLRELTDIPGTVAPRPVPGRDQLSPATA